MKLTDALTQAVGVSLDLHSHEVALLDPLGFTLYSTIAANEADAQQQVLFWQEIIHARIEKYHVDSPWDKRG